MSPGVSLRDASAVMAGLVRVMDVVMVASLAYLTHQLLAGWRDVGALNLSLVLIGAVLVYFVFPVVGVYRSWRGGGLVDLLGKVALAWFLTVVLVFAIVHLWRPDPMPSRLWLVSWAAVAVMALLAFRVLLYSLLRWMRRQGLNHRRVVLIGTENGVADLESRIASSSWSGFDLADRISLSVDDIASEQAMSRAIDRLVQLAASNSVQEVWITAPLRDEVMVRRVMDALLHFSVNIRYAPDIFALRLLNHAYSQVLGITMMDLSVTPMTGVNRVVKAVEDRVLAFLILVLISPLMGAIAVMVKVSSSGPVLFKQRRHGWDGREIKVYKFRSMVVHQEPDGVCTPCSRDDERVTKVGRFLRRYSLDELPQFYNVLQGRMSIVGPRPHSIYHNEYYKEQIDEYMLRHRVKPGITGWAQINGLRGEVDSLEKMQRRVEFDLYYIENWSLWFDLKIIFLTLWRGFKGENAY
ncbi:MAG: undecaprenyl-phosphate glucose phosphotransferase [Halothiobacillaceae bacterium]